MPKISCRAAWHRLRCIPDWCVSRWLIRTVAACSSQAGRPRCVVQWSSAHGVCMRAPRMRVMAEPRWCRRSTAEKSVQCACRVSSQVAGGAERGLREQSRTGGRWPRPRAPRHVGRALTSLPSPIPTVAARGCVRGPGRLAATHVRAVLMVGRRTWRRQWTVAKTSGACRVWPLRCLSPCAPARSGVAAALSGPTCSVLNSARVTGHQRRVASPGLI